MENISNKKELVNKKRKEVDQAIITQDGVTHTYETIEIKKTKKLNKQQESLTANTDNGEDDGTDEKTQLVTTEIPTDSSSSSSILTNQKFSDLPLSSNTLKALDTLGFSFMTEIQAKSIPQCLTGNDLVGAAKTGNTLQLICYMQCLYEWRLFNSINFDRLYMTILLYAYILMLLIKPFSYVT